MYPSVPIGMRRQVSSEGAALFGAFVPAGVSHLARYD
jgi:hypothetical protein